jgi:acyl-CoA synthetase (AMP-forming)/AMP-acid ligase II
MLLYCAASKAGVVPVPLNYRLAPAEWAFILNDAEADVLFAAEEFLPAVEGIRGELKALRLVVPRIVNMDGETVPLGELGEIAARGPQVMAGYWKREDATEEAIRGGWMHTGDAGRMDAEGFVYIEDRMKDMIISGGENVYPREVEQVLFSHAAVADAAAIGVPHEKWGETVKAFVVLKAGAEAGAEELIAHCRASLAGYKCPATVEFLRELPRNPSGKVLKRELREPYWAGKSRRVAGS